MLYLCLILYVVLLVLWIIFRFWTAMIVLGVCDGVFGLCSCKYDCDSCATLHRGIFFLCGVGFLCVLVFVFVFIALLCCYFLLLLYGFLCFLFFSSYTCERVIVCCQIGRLVCPVLFLLCGIVFSYVVISYAVLFIP